MNTNNTNDTNGKDAAPVVFDFKGSAVRVITGTAACMPESPDAISALGRAERACLALEAQVRAMDLMSPDDASGKEPA